MPPRFTYWTIILDGQPTAFRAAQREELLPTLKQLQTKNPAAVLKWFARGRVWESPEDARRARDEEAAAARAAAAEKARGREWRPGGEHRDPREKFKKETFQARKRREKKAADLARRAGPATGRPPGDAARFDAPRPGPRQDRPRPGGWQRDDTRPPRPPFGGDRQPKGGFTGGAHGGPARPNTPYHGPRQDRPRPGGWQRDDTRPPRPPFGGDRQPKGGFTGGAHGGPARPNTPYHGPRQDRPRPGGWQRDDTRPPRPPFGGDRQPKGGFTGSPRGPRDGPRGGQGLRGDERRGAFGRPPQQNRKPPYHEAPPRPKAGRPETAAAPPELPRKVAEPSFQVTEPRPKTTAPARGAAAPPTESFPSGPPAPAHKTRLPRLKKDTGGRSTGE